MNMSETDIPNINLINKINMSIFDIPISYNTHVRCKKECRYSMPFWLVSLILYFAFYDDD